MELRNISANSTIFYIRKVELVNNFNKQVYYFGIPNWAGVHSSELVVSTGIK